MYLLVVLNLIKTPFTVYRTVTRAEVDAAPVTDNADAPITCAEV